KSKVVASYENKLKSYKAYEISRLSSLEIETKVNKDRENLARWNEQLAQETASAVTTNLREISELLPTKEIQQTAFERPNGNGGFGNTTAQASSQIRIAFRGTFRTMQRAFLELETRMPRLQLQDLKIDPSSSGSMLLNFQVTYNAWEK
ncbi:MAG: hypothetical protein ACRDBP_04070, partial [Luteolibacter sp.]